MVGPTCQRACATGASAAGPCGAMAISGPGSAVPSVFPSSPPVCSASWGRAQPLGVGALPGAPRHVESMKAKEEVGRLSVPAVATGGRRVASWLTAGSFCVNAAVEVVFLCAYKTDVLSVDR